MITNSKNDFFQQLEYELERIGINLTDDIKADFEEHFTECADEGVSEEEAAKRLGDVKEIARNYLNLESTRINSMVARDIERKVSLTKPGHSVPADLSLIKEKDEQAAINSDCVREYTPEHLSEEIFPQSQNSQKQNNFTYNSTENPQNNAERESARTASQNTENAENTEKAKSGNNVADAFSTAGKAVADAAKITGSAIADAFGQMGVKEAVVNAGKSAADAVKTAGQTAAEAVKTASHNAAEKAKNIPHPSDSCREHSNHERKGTIPDNQNNVTNKKGTYFIDVRGLKPNVNAGKLIVAIVLDVFVWSWLYIALIGIVFGLIAAGIQHIFTSGIPAFLHTGRFVVYREIVSLLFGIGNSSLGLIMSLVGVCLIKPLLKLLKFIVEMHIKAVYDL